MAMRYLKGKKSPYQVYWNNPFTGRRESACYETESEAKKNDALIKYQLKYERERFRPKEEEISAQPVPAHTLESVYYLYLKDRRFSEQGFIWSIESMRQILNIIGMAPIEDITEDELTKLKSDLLASTVKPSTIRRRMATLKATLRWAERVKIISRCPLFPIINGVQHERLVPPSPREIVEIMEAAAPHIRRVVILGTQFGMRVGPCEMFRLTWSDIDIARKIIRVPAAKKNSREPWRDVPMRESLVPVFTRWMQEDAEIGATHVVNFDGKPVKAIKTAWAAALRRAGITRKIRPYDLRHAFATEALAADIDEGTVARIMGHTSTRMLHDYYQHVSDGQKRKAMERLPDVKYVHEVMCPN